MKKVTVIGAGIIGLSVAYYLHKQGAEVTVIDKDPAGDKVSFGNAGSIAVMEVNPAAMPGVLMKVPGWMLDPLGPLSVRPAHSLKMLPWLYRFYKAGRKNAALPLHQALAALNRRAFDDLHSMLSDTGLSQELHRKGALIVYESDAGFEADKAVWEMRKRAGVEAHYLSSQEARQLEPDLGSRVRHGVFAPQAGVVSDPKVLTDKLREWLASHGVRILQGEVTGIRPAAHGTQQVLLSDDLRIDADDVVIAAGVWSEALTRQLGEKCCLESERGYNTTLKAPQVSLSREVIFAERKFVITPLSCGLRIGGAAEFGGITSPPNYQRSEALVTLAKMYLPALDSGQGTPWAGHRPSTPDSLPVIGPSLAHKHVFYAFGHGHLGLTQCATTGQLIADLVYGHTTAVDLTPYSIARFQ